MTSIQVVINLLWLYVIKLTQFSFFTQPLYQISYSAEVWPNWEWGEAWFCPSLLLFIVISDRAIIQETFKVSIKYSRYLDVTYSNIQMYFIYSACFNIHWLLSRVGRFSKNLLICVRISNYHHFSNIFICRVKTIWKNVMMDQVCCKQENRVGYFPFFQTSS